MPEMPLNLPHEPSTHARIGRVSISRVSEALVSIKDKRDRRRELLIGKSERRPWAAQDRKPLLCSGDRLKASVIP